MIPKLKKNPKNFLNYNIFDPELQGCSKKL